MKYLGFLLIAAFVLFLNIYPNYHAYLNTPEGKVFTGQASWFDPWDLNVYVAAIKYGQNNGPLLENNFTTTSHTAVLMYPLYTITGSFFPQVDPFLLFHLLATVVGFILLLVLWKIIQVFIPSPQKSLMVLFLVSLGGGVGWLFFPNTSSADLFMTGFTFLSHFQRAHEGLGIIFYLLSLVLFFYSSKLNVSILYILSLITLILLIFFYPYYLLSYALICGLFAIYLHLKDNQIKPLFFLIFNTLLSSAVLYFYWNHLQGNPGFSGVLAQDLKTPDFLQLILGYGILIPILIYQLKKGERSKAYYFLNIWFFTSLLLSFLPFGFARFYLRTLFLPLVILVFLTLQPLAKTLRVTPKIFLIILIITLPISSLYITYKRITETSNNNHWFYLTTSEQKLINFLNQEGQEKGVLSSYTLGNIIPAKTDSRVYFGHLLQTPQSVEKIQNLVRFYSNNLTEEGALSLLKKEGIKYIVYGAEEQEITWSKSQEKLLKYTFLKPIKPTISEDNTQLYTYDD